MKFQQDSSKSPMVLQFDGHSLVVGMAADAMPNKQTFTHSLLLPAYASPEPWDCNSATALLPNHWERVLALAPQVLIVGTGARQQFFAPAQLAPLFQARIGHECMDSAAACRTYNVLAAEGRRVLLALLLH